MDQASLLREMMKKKQKVDKIPFGFMFLGKKREEQEEINQLIIEKIKEDSKKICVLKNLKETEKIFVESNEKTGLNLEKIIKEEESIREEIIKIIEKKEKRSEQMVIEAGRGIDYSTVNAMLLVSESMIVMDLKEETEKELFDYLSILKKLEKKQRIALVVEEEDGMENKINKIQEKVWDKFNYYIEVIGIFEKNERVVFKELDLSRYERENEEEKISISLKNRFS